MATADAQTETEMATVRATARFLRIAPRKARLVADQVRGLPVPEAQTLLRFSSRGAARDLAKLIDSAAANAENNHDLVADDMRITELRVDEGPTLKRWRARARGRAARVEKKTCHASVVLAPIDEE
jgi:large subunit ribosomal protein L22